jgi:putative transposase
MQKERFQVEIVLDLIADVRRKAPRLGGRKLYHLLCDDFKKLGYKLGRDGLFEVLKEHDLLIKRRKNYTKTTNSFHRYHVYENLINGLEIVRPNQVFVSDITYIRVQKSFMYLSLITDLYSRMIVGWCLNETLEASGCLSALRMALKQVEKPSELIHHSDRGVQYCSGDYTGLLLAEGVRISMAEQGNPYENAHAERVNGILKDEFFLNAEFISRKFAQKAVSQAVDTYNTFRPHLSLKMRTPAAVYFDKNKQHIGRKFCPLQGAALGFQVWPNQVHGTEMAVY